MNEKYIPLYRKYRPQILEDVVGQEHVKKALSNAIELNKISHAYLFTGPRGTGKTSTARILAKSLNCVNGPTVKPCGKCASCVDIANSTPIDVIEIDAASNRSVNDAQNILEKIQYAPVNGKYKIYIIDEVHMLTVQAFNALLKTLEEPPENVVFILATTEVHKVLDTIKSRCQRFDFKRITTDDIVNHLKHIAELEKINIEDDAIMTIAKNAAGGMRDSLALLDQLSVLDTEKAITTEDINSLLGRLSFDVLNRLSDSIIASEPNSAIEILEEIYNSGNEPSQILLNLLDYFKNMLVVKNCKTDLVLELTQTTDSQSEILKKQADSLETHQIVFLIERTSHYINELKSTTNQHTWLEVAMIDLANLAENTKLIQLQSRLQKLETSETTHIPVSNYKTPPLPVQKPSMKPAGMVSNQLPVSKKTDSTVSAHFDTKLHDNSVSSRVDVEKTQSEQVNTQISSDSADREVKQIKPENVIQADSESEKTELKNLKSETDNINTQNNSEKNVVSDDFSPVPMSSKEVKTDDLVILWKSLLENISSVPTKQLLLQLAKPVVITPESVVITMKSESFIKQLNESSKKQTLINAVDLLFNQKNSNVIIRLPQASDSEVKKVSISESKTQNSVEEKISNQNQKKYDENSANLNSHNSETDESERKVYYQINKSEIAKSDEDYNKRADNNSELTENGENFNKNVGNKSEISESAEGLNKNFGSKPEIDESREDVYKRTDNPEMIEVVGIADETTLNDKSNNGESLNNDKISVDLENSESYDSVQDKSDKKSELLSDQAKMVKDLFEGKIVE